MRPPTLATVLAVALVSIAGCGSGSDNPAAPTSPTTTASASDSPGTNPAAGPALTRKPGSDFTYCSNTGPRGGDYVWSGTQFTAVTDATLDRAAPLELGGVRVVGSWVVEQEKDNGMFVRWRDRPGYLRGSLTRAEGAALTAGTTYRLVLRLRPQELPARLADTTVDYTAAGTSGSLTDTATLQFKQHC